MRRNAIAIIRKDNVALSEELRIENQHSISPTTLLGNALLNQLQDECDILTRKVDTLTISSFAVLWSLMCQRHNLIINAASTCC